MSTLKKEMQMMKPEDVELEKVFFNLFDTTLIPQIIAANTYDGWIG